MRNCALFVVLTSVASAACGDAAGTSPAAQPVQAATVAITPGDLSHAQRFGDGVVGRILGDVVRYDANGELVWSKPDGDGESFGALAVDATSERIASLSWAKPETLTLRDSSGNARWTASFPTSHSGRWLTNTIAVRGEEVLIAGVARGDTADIGCAELARGLFVASFSAGKCARISNVVTPTTRLDETDEVLGSAGFAIRSDGSFAVSGWFERWARIGGKEFNASSPFRTAFVAVFDPSGVLSWARASMDEGDLQALRFTPDGRTLIAAGAGGVNGLDLGAGVVANARAAVLALDAESGKGLWAHGLYGKSATISDVDARGRLVVGADDCTEKVAAADRIESPSMADGLEICLAGLRVTDGAPLFVKRLGPTLRIRSLVGDDEGFWLGAWLRGRPDFGLGRIDGGGSALVRFVYR